VCYDDDIGVQVVLVKNQIASGKAVCESECDECEVGVSES